MPPKTSQPRKHRQPELLECLKSWFRLGIFIEEGLHAIVDTMQDDGAIEALEEALDQ